MKVLRTENNLVLDVAPIIRFENDYPDFDVIRVEYSDGYFYYVGTQDRLQYEILERFDIPSNFYPSGYFLDGDNWIYIPPPVLPDPLEDPLL